MTLGSSSDPILYSKATVPATNAVIAMPKLAKSQNSVLMSFFSHAVPPHCTVFVVPSSL